MHHAYVVLGAGGEVEVERMLGAAGINLEANPDIFHVSTESFSVDDARTINERALGKAFGALRVFIISAERYTPEAQNALLKTLEEPIEGTHFFLLGRERALFLPTLISRVEVMETRQGGEDGGKNNEAGKFLSLAPKKRLEFARDFEDSLPQFLDELLVDLKSKNTPLPTLKKVFDLRLYASDPAVSARLILEHLALTL
jgi:hypothetical protein